MGSLLVIMVWDGMKDRCEFAELVAAAWETRRLLGGLASTSLELPWGFLLVFESGLARFYWIL